MSQSAFTLLKDEKCCRKFQETDSKTGNLTANSKKRQNIDSVYDAKPSCKCKVDLVKNLLDDDDFENLFSNVDWDKLTNLKNKSVTIVDEEICSHSPKTDFDILNSLSELLLTVKSIDKKCDYRFLQIAFTDSKLCVYLVIRN